MTTSTTTTMSATIAMQEDAMWAAHRACQEETFSSFDSIVDTLPENERTAALEFLTGDDGDNDDDDPSDSFSMTACRSDITLFGPSHIYPKGKGSQTSKRRRYDKHKRNEPSRLHGNP